MRNFSKKLAFVLAAAMVFTAFAPAAKAEAAEDMAINKKSQTLYVNEGLNHKGAETLPEGLYGNVSEYDFYVANKPADWKTAYTFAWSSSDEDVMTVGKAGLATAVAPGKADVVCVVTEKATGKATTLKAAVTVKANAEELTITNAADYDMQSVVAGGKVALQYKMVAENNGKATDLVRWVAEPATGVTVKDGVFTFGEDAVAGDYTLYAEAYQSEKYNQTTATSEKIVVTFVADNSFEVEQNTVKTFTVKFDAPVKAVGDVVVNRLYKGFELPALVKSVKLADDGMSATVEMFTALKNNEEYAINVAGYETYTLTASAGDPVEVLIYVSDKEIGKEAEIIYVDGNPVTLKYKLIDAKGVDVTDVAGGTVLFNAKTYSTDGSYYVSADQMWFAKEGVDIEVIADYQSGRYENGVQLAPAKGSKLFYSMKKEPVQVLGLADWKIAGTKNDWSDKAQTVAFGDPATLAVKIKLTEGDPVVAGAMGAVLDGYITFQEINPEVAALSGSNIVFFKQGVAKILVFYNYTENGAPVELPIAQINAEATAPRALQSMALDKVGVIALGTEDGYDEVTIAVTAKNNYGGDYDVSGKVTIEGVDDNSKAALVKDVSYTIAADGKITLYGYELKENTPNKPATVQLTFKVKVDGKLEQNVTVLLKSRGAVGTEYIQLEAEGFGKDVARTESSKDAKTGSFTVYKYSNGIKVGTQAVEAYDANNITANAFYFKVTKDGNDVTNKVASNVNGKVTINFSSVDNTIVKYTDFGAGNYVFTLYKGVAVGNKAIPVQQTTAVGAVTCNVGSYGNAVRIKDTLAGDTSDAGLRAAFSIKNTKGEETTAAYTVKATGANDAAMKYVYVESFTFKDDLGDGTFAEYTVPVGIALMK